MRNRRGFTLIEMMLSVTILLVIMGVAVQFLRRQGNLVSSTTRQMDALQNAEFSATQIERELREAGAGIADIQPMIVQAQTDAITFNANMMSIDSGDVRAVYRSRDADTNAVRVMYSSEKLPLPNTVGALNSYPDTTYMANNGFVSGAETISYYLRPDSTNAGQANRYLLFRRVNATPATMIARDIVRDPRDTTPFFTYYKADTLGKLYSVPDIRLPALHTRIHGAVADTGRSALTDSIRVVRVHFATVALDRKAGKDSIKLRRVETKIRLMNAGLLNFSACGQRPLAVAQPSVTTSGTGSTPRKVTLTWNKSADDGAGEKDVERYAIFRRASAATAMGDPISSISGKIGAVSYQFVDTDVQRGATYVYGVSAQDCTPSVSDVSQSLPITVNP